MELAKLKPQLSAVPFINGMDPYSVKTPRRQFDVRKFIDKVVVANSENHIREKSTFVKDYIHFEKLADVETMLNELIEDDKISKVFQKKIVDKACYRASTSEINRTRSFVERKRMQLSKCKKNLFRNACKNIAVKISSKVAVKNSAVHHNSRSDKTSRNHLLVAFPLHLPKAVRDDTIQVEHALVDTVAMV